MASDVRFRGLRIPVALFVVGFGTTSACGDDDDGDGPIAMCTEIRDDASCEDADGCAWDPVDLECVVECARIETMMLCDEQDQCFWDGGTCHYGIA
jgi:hypothetical protein